MGIAKKIKFESFFIFLFLIVFPFGQIIRMNFNFVGLNIPLQPLDIIAGLGGLYSIVFQKRKTKILKYLSYFLAIAGFSYFVSIFIFKMDAIYGAFYLMRLGVYTFFVNYVWNFAVKNQKNKKLLLDSLLAISVISAVFGWIQYFTIPDLKPLFYIGWDMHLYRLAGTLLDPTFLGLIIVFGLLLAIDRLIDSKEKKYLLITLFLLVSIAFTYARACYLAFGVGFLLLVILKNKSKKILFLILGLVAIAVILPTAKNHSIELTRTFSISARFNNYREALVVFSKSPLLGVGFDNMCVARNKYIGEEPFASHACSGSDSSLLLVLATTGICGMVIFLSGVYKIIMELFKNKKEFLALSAISALFVHSLFSNSLFFPWVMGYVGILIATEARE